MTGGWPNNIDDLKTAVLQAWDNISLDSFLELIRSYKHRLLSILSVRMKAVTDIHRMHKCMMLTHIT